MQNIPNNQIPVVTLVLENVPSEQGRIRARISRCAKSSKPVFAFVVASALSLGICGAINWDSSKCINYAVAAGITAGLVRGIYDCYINEMERFRSRINVVSSASIAQSANSALVVEGITVFSGSLSAPELNSASREHSPRSSFDLERGPSSNNLSAIMVFSNSNNR